MRGLYAVGGGAEAHADATRATQTPPPHVARQPNGLVGVAGCPGLGAGGSRAAWRSRLALWRRAFAIKVRQVWQADLEAPPRVARLARIPNPMGAKPQRRRRAQGVGCEERREERILSPALHA